MDMHAIQFAKNLPMIVTVGISLPLKGNVELIMGFFILQLVIAPWILFLIITLSCLIVSLQSQHLSGQNPDPAVIVPVRLEES